MPLIALGHTRISTLRGMRNVDFSGKSEMQCSACNFAAGHMARNARIVAGPRQWPGTGWTPCAVDYP